MRIISAEEFKKKYGTVGFEKLTQSEKKKPGIFDRVKQSVQDTADRNVDITQGTGEYQGQGNIRRGFELAGNTARGIFDVVLGTPIRAAGEKLGGTQVMQDLVTKRPELANKIENVARPLADPIGSAGNQLGKSKFFQQAAEGIDQNPNSWAAKTESGLSIAKNTGDVANLVLAGDLAARGGQKVVDKTKQLGTKVYNKVADSFPDGGGGGPGLKDQIRDYYGKQIKSDWERPAKTPNASYKKAAEIYNRASAKKHDISDTLIKNKLDPNQLAENGKFQTLEAAQQVRADAMKTSSDLLRPSLAQADNFTPRISVKDVFQAAANRIKASTKLTEGTKISLLKKLQSEYQAVQAKHPEGLKLTDLHDQGITYDINAEYSPVGDIATNNAAAMNEAIGSAFRATLRAKAPPGIPVKEFKFEIGKQFQAANYLEALNNKKVPMTLASRITNTAGKAVGAAGAYQMGGGIIGGVAGYHLGGMLETLLVNLPNPLRAQFLANLKISNPAAFNQLSQFMQAEFQAGLGRKALPPATTIFGQPKTPPAYKSEVLPAQKQIYRDPKTGQIKRGYTSQSGEPLYPNRPKSYGPGAMSKGEMRKIDPLIQEAKKYKRISPSEFATVKENNLTEVSLVKDAKDQYRLIYKDAGNGKTGVYDKTFNNFDEALQAAKNHDAHAKQLNETISRMSPGE